MKHKNTINKNNNRNFLSNVLNIIKNPFFIIGFILFLAIIIYIVIIHKQSKPSPSTTCDADKQILCQDQCIDINGDSVCTGDNKICLRTKFCSYNNSCCAESEFCDTQTQKCKGCEPGRAICSGNCCADGESCDGKNKCCKNDKITKDGCCENGEVCLATDGTKTCCTSGSGLACNTLTGKCEIGCPNKDNLSIYKCPGDPNPSIPTTSHICGDGKICTVDCGKKIDEDGRYTCIEESQCKWNSTVYDPPLLTYGGAGTDPDKGTVYHNKKPVNQCINPIDKSVWVKPLQNIGNINSTVSVNSTDGSPSYCTLPMCINKIQEEATSVIKGDLIKGDISSQGNYDCSSQLQCEKALLKEDDQTGIDEICNDINSSSEYSGKNIYTGYNTNGRCCQNIQGNNTGQICSYDEFCDPSSLKCATGFKFVDNGSLGGGRCQPDYDNKQNRTSFEQCLKNNAICGGKTAYVGECDDWNTCFCCPEYKACKNCSYTYKMPNINLPISTSGPFIDDVLNWSGNQGGVFSPTSFDNLLYIMTPTSVTFNYTDSNKSINYFDKGAGHGSPKIYLKASYPELKFDTTLNIFAINFNASPAPTTHCMDFTFTLDDPSTIYTVHLKSTGGGGGCGSCVGDGWCIKINVNGTEYKNNNNTPSNFLDKNINAWVQIGNNNQSRVGKIWISNPSKQNNYLDWGSQICPQPNDIPTSSIPITTSYIPIKTQKTQKTQKTKKSKILINVFLILILLIFSIFLLFYFLKIKI